MDGPLVDLDVDGFSSAVSSEIAPNKLNIFKLWIGCKKTLISGLTSYFSIRQTCTVYVIIFIFGEYFVIS